MIRSYKLLLLVFLLTCNFKLMADSLKIGVINTNKLFEQSLFGQSIREKMQSEFMPRKEKIDKMQNELNDKHSALQRDKDILTEKEVVSRERELGKIQQDLQRLMQELDIDMQSKQQEEISVFDNELNLAVKDIANEYKYDIILPIQATMYNTAAVECTEKVIEYLDKRYKR